MTATLRFFYYAAATEDIGGITVERSIRATRPDSFTWAVKLSGGKAATGYAGSLEAANQSITRYLERQGIEPAAAL